MAEIEPTTVPDFEPVEEEDAEGDAPIGGEEAGGAGVGGGGDRTTAPFSGVRVTGFSDLLLRPECNQAIRDAGFEHPSEVQHQCIPSAILGKDIICQAKSGMGKTAVFVISVLQQLEEGEGTKKDIHCVVLVHTRELAYQIHNEFTRFGKYLEGAKVAVFYGGTPVAKDLEVLKPGGKDYPNIVVGTPGRVLHLVNQGALVLDKVKHFVVDECDKVLESVGMRRDVQSIYLQTPKAKQVMMFTATMPVHLKETARKFMQNPLEVYVDSDAKLTLDGLLQYYVKVTESQKNRKLADLLDSLEFNQVVIFVKSVDRSKALAKLLNDVKFPALCMHSQMEMQNRISNFDSFKTFKGRIMVATDLMGRGIDVERVNVVINYDMPDGADTYLHRVGRAGRFGTKGLAITLISQEADTTTMEEVQKRFEVSVPELPSEIAPHTYMHS